MLRRGKDFAVLEGNMAAVKLREIRQQRREARCIVRRELAAHQPRLSYTLDLAMAAVGAVMIPFKGVYAREQVLSFARVEAAQTREEALLLIGSMPRGSFAKIPKAGFKRGALLRSKRPALKLSG